ACLYTTGSAMTGLVSAQVIQLTQGVLKTMMLGKIKTGLIIIISIGLLTMGTGLGVRSGISGGDAWADERSNQRPPDSAAPDGFRDIAVQAGIDFRYRNGEEAGHCTVLESLGGGVAVLDYDGDGLLDIFLPGGGYFDGPNKQQIHGHPCKLYKNLGH